MDKTYTKLSALVDQDVTINKVNGYKFRMWSQADNRYVLQDTWAKDFDKVYPLDTDKGELTVTRSQLGQMLEAAQHQGKVDLNGKTVHIKSNGKTGQDIRYYFDVLDTKSDIEEHGDDSGKDEVVQDHHEAPEQYIPPEGIPY